MAQDSALDWKKRVVSPAKVLERIEPGGSIFIGTGMAEPRTLVRHLMATEAPNLQDLELIQLVSFGEAISLGSTKYRLKTFFSGWVASDAIRAGRIDLIPSRFSRIPRLIRSGRLRIDVAFIQITPPDAAGYSSLGLAVDVARLAMERATLKVGEINRQVPMTYGDTLIPLSEFDLLVEAEDPPFSFNRWPMDPAFERVAVQVASVIENGACIGFSLGPLYEALSRHLVNKRDLGVHSPFFTDPLMDLVKSGAVTNRRKRITKGRSLASYAFGSTDLLKWLDKNPRVEFQDIESVCNPVRIGQNPGFVAVLPARKVDLSGRIALHIGKGNVAAGPGEAADFVNGAEMSRGGLSVFALPSRNRKGEGNIRLSVEELPNQFSLRESVDMVATEYGVAALGGRTVRERAQALIEIAHPDDRPQLVQQAKDTHMIYPDQIFLAESAHLYPQEIATAHHFKDGQRVRFRAIRPSDEEEMRRLFYRFSDKAVYYRYFTPIKAMPHARMQSYVNVDYRQSMSLVGVVGEVGQGRIIAEARYVRHQDRPWADVAFVVDGEYEGRGIATWMYAMLVRLARERGLQGFTADVLASNMGMMKVFEKGGSPVRARLSDGAYELSIPFDPQTDT
ncbi:MAG: GNAT family N-acetyltransferase [Desulfobacterales bacterium]|nr:GNAT family N-acetyltransferase [Desulfobacterales bacterium]